MFPSRSREVGASHGVQENGIVKKEGEHEKPTLIARRECLEDVSK